MKLLAKVWSAPVTVLSLCKVVPFSEIEVGKFSVFQWRLQENPDIVWVILEQLQAGSSGHAYGEFAGYIIRFNAQRHTVWGKQISISTPGVATHLTQPSIDIYEIL